MQFFPILQGLERNGMVVDEQKGNSWAQRRGDWAERVHLYYIGKWWVLYRQMAGCGVSFCLRGKLDGTNGLVSGKTLDCIRPLKKPRDVG